jgi:hypothetical protein
MLIVMTTTTTAIVIELSRLFTGIGTQLGNAAGPVRNAELFKHTLHAGLVLAMVISAAVVVVSAAIRVWRVTSGAVPPGRAFEPVTPAA